MKQLIFPIKRPILAMTIAGIFLGIRIGLGFLSFSIGPMKVSFSGITLYAAGFFLGPIIGFIFGAIGDTIGFFIHPSPAGGMWQYSMQEPIIAFLGGLSYIAYTLIKDSGRSKGILFAVFETIFTGMMAFAVIYLSIHIDGHSSQITNKSHGTNTQGVKGLAIALALVLYIGINIYVLYRTIKNKQPKLLMLVTLLVLIPYLLFSGIFGVDFYIIFITKANNNGHYSFKLSQNYTKYGGIGYGLPRIIKSLIVIPIEITITFPLIYSLTKLNSNSNVG